MGLLDFTCRTHRSKGPLWCCFVIKSTSCHRPPTDDVRKANRFNDLLFVFLLLFLEDVLFDK